MVLILNVETWTNYIPDHKNCDILRKKIVKYSFKTNLHNGGILIRV